MLRWRVTASEPEKHWVAETSADFLGPIIVDYAFEALAKGATRFTRTVRNPARPWPPTGAMIARMDAEAALGLDNIRRRVDARLRDG